MDVCASGQPPMFVTFDGYEKTLTPSCLFHFLAAIVLRNYRTASAHGVFLASFSFTFSR